MIFAAISALFAIDTLLAGKERAETLSQARQLFQEGLSLADHNRNVEAIDRLRSALSMERGNPAYQRALAAALLRAGKVPDAEAVAADRLQREPTDAGASLIMARTLVREGKLPQAIAFYHRAIFGRWEDDRLGDRVQARFELVDLLARERSRQELLAELLPLQDEAPGDVRTRERIARLFIAAGSPIRAIEIFRDVLRHDRDDAEAYAGLGEAEFQRANYRAARTNFVAALSLMPGNQDIAARLALCNQVLALDPTQRALRTDDQYHRSLNLLRLTLGAMDNCVGSPSLQPRQGLTDSARTALARRGSVLRFHDAVEENLDLAERLWDARRRACSQPVAESEKALELVLEKAAQ